MRYFLLMVAFAATCFSTSAQSFGDFEDFEDFSWIGMLRYTHFSDPYQPTVKGLTANVAVRAASFEKGGASFHYENPTLGDFVYVLFHIKKAFNNQTVDKSYGGGFFGWFQGYQNVVVKNRFLLAPGISMGDYIFGIQQPNVGPPSKLEPNGYYFHIGPALKTAVVLNNSLFLEAFVQNDIAFKASKVQGGDYEYIKGYKRPHFINVTANIHHRSRVYGGVRMSKINDRGSNDIKATRIDVSMGYMF